MISRKLRPVAVPAAIGVGLALLLAVPTPAAKKSEVSDQVLALHPEILEMRQQVAESPTRAALHNDLGNMYARRGWDDLAIESYTEAVRLAPQFYVAWTNLGTVYSKLGQDDRARRAFETAIGLQPRAALAHYNLGVILERQGRYDAALESYKEAVTLDPSMLDPGVNPQIVNNEHEVPIRLLRYLETVGSSSLPLTDTPRGLLEAAEEVRAMRESGELPPGTGGTVVPAVPSPEGDAGPSSAAPASAHEKPRLGGLQMYRGRAERRLIERAEKAGGDDDTPAAEGDTAANDEDAPANDDSPSR